MELKQRLKLFLKGVFMGMADIVPGVSGGTIALITGIYERLIEAIDSIKPTDLSTVDFKFLIPVGLGVVTAFFLVSQVILTLLESFQSFIYAFFFGLILASAVVVYRRTSHVDIKTISSSLLGFVIAFVIAGMESLALMHGPLIIYFSGFLAICAMLMPGVSGSFVILLLGQYEYMLNAIHNINAYFTEVSVFLLGCITSVATFPRLVDWFLGNYKEVTFSFLIGLMIGALRLPVIKISFQNNLIGSVISGVFGLSLVLILERLSK